MDNLDAFPPLIPTQAAPVKKERNEPGLDDRFNILFSPPTPRASPTIPNVANDARSSVHQDLLTGNNLVAVSEDPLSSFATQDSRQENTTLSFFDQFGRNAKASSERNKKQFLDELNDEPLHWLSERKEPVPEDRLAQSLSDLDIDFFSSKSRQSPPARSTSVPPPTIAPPVASDAGIVRPPLSPNRSSSYQTLSNISARWKSDLPSSSHPRTSSLDAFFDPAIASAHQQAVADPTLSRIAPPSSVPVNISHGSPFGPSTKPSPFAAHVFVPSSGAPGYKGEQYDWDKGYSTELEKELHNRKTVAEMKVSVGDLVEKKNGNIELKGRKEMTVPILDPLLADMIRPHLPALSRLSRSWNLLYSLDQHGISLNTLYDRCSPPPKPGRNGALLVIKDASDAFFGAWSPEGIHLSKGAYYGSGESFLWKYTNSNFQIFKWTGQNDYVALCEQEFLSFGGGDGNYGLYLDETLLDGSSAPCPTFNNEPLCSSGAKRGGSVAFECVGLEVWGIGT